MPQQAVVLRNRKQVVINKENDLPGRKSDRKTSFLIVEESFDPEAAHGKRHGPKGNATTSQFWLISSRDIVDIAVISNETVYTGKQLKFRNKESKVCSGTCVLFSPDLQFVKDQFRQFTTNTMENDKAPLVLNISTKGNVMNDHGMNVSMVSGKRNATTYKLPNTITVKSVKVMPKEEAIDLVKLGDPDAENRPPMGDFAHPQMEVLQMGRAMTFDQQSQTDFKVTGYETVVPATAAQMHQQATQIAQLIRANNGLVIEMRQLKESNQTMKELSVQLDQKLSRALDLLGEQVAARALVGNGMVGVAKEEVVENHAHMRSFEVSYQGEESNMSNIIEYAETQPAQESYSVSYTVPASVASSREHSLSRSIKSENTPPLKKNKAKLSKSMEQVANQSLNLSADELQMIGARGTLVPRKVLQGLGYDNYKTATRRILSAVFDRETLATHSLTGKPSPAFLERGSKSQLDHNKVQDIVDYISEACKVNESAIRGVITSKCADENKMMRLNAKKLADESMEMAAPNKKRRTMH